MPTKAIRLNATEIISFVSVKKACVLHATVGSTTEFNTTLLTSLRSYLKLPFSVGSVDIRHVDYEDPFIKKLISNQMEHIGLAASGSLLPGYYLFKNGELAAYHPGTFDISRLDPDMVSTTMKIAAGVGILTALFLKNVSSGLQMFTQLGEVPTGMSIFEFFKEVLEAKSELDILKKQQYIFKTELDNAYVLLGLSSSATDSEVKSAYKKKMLECHPDRNRGEEQTSTKLTVKVIEAYVLIMGERKAATVEI